MTILSNANRKLISIKTYKFESNKKCKKLYCWISKEHIWIDIELLEHNKFHDLHM